MLPSPDPETADYLVCRAALRGGSRSFHAAAKLLPRSIRDPAIALYAFCREADDAIDTGAGNLAWLRERLSRIYEGRPLPIAADRGLTRVVEQFALPRALLDALLDGFALDAEGRRCPDLPSLRAYAVRVAGTVGAMMAVLMNVRDRERLGAAVNLGVAMQLSNIARDVGEDARNGRLYLPLDWLAEAGIDPHTFLAAPVFSDALAGVVRRVLDAAEIHYQHAATGIAKLPLSCRLGIGAAQLLYAEIGREVARRGLDSVGSRAVVSERRKLGVLALGLPGIMLPRGTLSATACVPEGMFLVEAVVRATPASAQASPVAPWWALAARGRRALDLFEALERRQWQES